MQYWLQKSNALPSLFAQVPVLSLRCHLEVETPIAKQGETLGDRLSEVRWKGMCGKEGVVGHWLLNRTPSLCPLFLEVMVRFQLRL
jgi:hypothetical protein